MEKYIVVIEKTETGYSAFSPDVPGCITVGKTVEDTINNMHEAIYLYLETLLEEDKQLPTGKGIEHHIKNGLLQKGEIAEHYYLTEIEVQLPEMV